MVDIALSIIRDIQPGRLAESLIFLFVLWNRMKPHMKKIEDRMEGMEKSINTLSESMKTGFTAGESRFKAIETRLDKVEAENKNESSLVM